MHCWIRYQQLQKVGQYLRKIVGQQYPRKEMNENDCYVDFNKKNIGAKVLSAKLAKVLNILTTSVTPYSCNATEHVAKSGEIR